MADICINGTTKFVISVIDFIPRNKRKDSNEWAKIEIEIANYYLQFKKTSEYLTCFEIEELINWFKKFLNNELIKDEEITFLEPEISFKVFDKTILYFHLEFPCSDGSYFDGIWETGLNFSEVKQLLNGLIEEVNQFLENDERIAYYEANYEVYYVINYFDKYYYSKNLIKLNDTVAIIYEEDFIKFKVTEVKKYSNDNLPIPLIKMEKIYTKITKNIYKKFSSEALNTSLGEIIVKINDNKIKYLHLPLKIKPKDNENKSFYDNVDEAYILFINTQKCRKSSLITFDVDNKKISKEICRGEKMHAIDFEKNGYKLVTIAFYTLENEINAAYYVYSNAIELCRKQDFIYAIVTWNKKMNDGCDTWLAAEPSPYNKEIRECITNYLNFYEILD